MKADSSDKIQAPILSHLPQASDFTARALPTNPFITPDLHAAFNLCLDLESRAVPLPDPRHPPAVLCARVLGYTLIEAPSRDHLAGSINKRSSDDDLLALGRYYICRLFKAVKGPTSVPSDSPSPPSIEYEQSSLTIKEVVLLRDGHHCMLRTDLYDISYVEQNPSILEAQSLNWAFSSLYCTYIFPESNLGDGAEHPSDKLEWAASVWAAMHMFGMEELNGAGNHRLENVLTLCDVLHEYFGKLDDGQPNTYVAVSTMFGLIGRLPSRVVTFTTPDPKALPLPNPAYLALHAACRRVAHMSGAADYVKNALQEEEEVRNRIETMGVLAEDGSSMDLFERYIATRLIEITTT
ncbi:uncharacterized protein EV420DRAFT_1768322 [Desarmillaria tabescens]|uniref:HNH nuclease domain-containing protein n=1 Tax=Armillaria tabescens TaxID=1929756 RepID=A0AA39JMS7_ARMTA|nr:uncharacterized protein EV420DRAFT_1768322 [Desarmillaria tabescens]KAK0444204.1 hypothetical protein EV420DRAFT_1768322 [Desarmillaria tabescens]